MRTYNLFISHSWKHKDDYNHLVNLLNNKKYFSYSNYSVPEEDPIIGVRTDRELKEAIRNQMIHASCVIALAGVYCTPSKWINYEIELAKELGKKIIAVVPWGNERISDVVRDAADIKVRWDTDSIVNAIREVCD
ncbi:MAG: TIR domain-containing protein [Clostridia bacterium]|nr:TIR domain-containing protein [Clostridia bacterium]